MHRQTVPQASSILPSWEDLGIFPEDYVDESGESVSEASAPLHYETGSVIAVQRGEDAIKITMDPDAVKGELSFARTGDTVFEEVEWADHWDSLSTENPRRRRQPGRAVPTRGSTNPHQTG